MSAAPFSLPSSRPCRSFPSRNESLIYPIFVSLVKKQVTRPKRVRLRCGSRVRLARPRQWNYSHSRLLGYLPNGQSTRYPPFRILDRPGLSWRFRRARSSESGFFSSLTFVIFLPSFENRVLGGHGTLT